MKSMRSEQEGRALSLGERALRKAGDKLARMGDGGKACRGIFMHEPELPIEIIKVMLQNDE